MGLIYDDRVYLGVRTLCELFFWFASRFECVDVFVFFVNHVFHRFLHRRWALKAQGGFHFDRMPGCSDTRSFSFSPRPPKT